MSYTQSREQAILLLRKWPWTDGPALHAASVTSITSYPRLLRRWASLGSVKCSSLHLGYQNWLDSLPGNLRDGATTKALAAAYAPDLSELEGMESPRGFGRD